MASSIERFRAIESMGIPFERIKSDLLKGFVVSWEDKLGQKGQIVEVITRRSKTYFSLQLRNHGGVDLSALMIGGSIIIEPGVILEIIRTDHTPMMPREGGYDGFLSFKINNEQLSKSFSPQGGGLNESEFLSWYLESSLDKSATEQVKKAWEQNYEVGWVSEGPLELQRGD